MSNKSVNTILALGLLGLSACGFDANIPNQTTFQRIEGRSLTVGFEDGVRNASFGAGGITVRDTGDRPLTEDDGPVAQRAARAHCAEFAERLETRAGVFYPAGAMWQFGRCVE